jgi:hypothetical protein
LNTSDALWDAFQAVVIQIQCIEWSQKLRC